MSLQFVKKHTSLLLPKRYLFIFFNFLLCALTSVVAVISSEGGKKITQAFLAAVCVVVSQFDRSIQIPSQTICAENPLSFFFILNLDVAVLPSTLYVNGN